MGRILNQGQECQTPATGRAGPTPRRKRKSSAASTNKKKKSPTESIFRTIAESTAKSADATEAKSAAVSYASLSFARQNAEQALENAKKKKQSAKRGLKSHSFTAGNNSRARKIIKNTKKKMAPSPGKEDSDDEPMVYSQSTTDSIRALGSFDTVQQHATEYIEAEKQITERTEELRHLKKEINDSLCAVSKK